MQDDMVNSVKVFATPLHTQACPVTILMPDKYLKLEENGPEDGETGTGAPSYTTAICRGPQQDRLQSQHHLRQLLSFRSSIDEEYFQVLSNGQSLCIAVLYNDSPLNIISPESCFFPFTSFPCLFLLKLTMKV